MKKNIYKTLFLISLASLLITPFLAQAVVIQPPVRWTTLGELIDKLIDFIFYIAVVVLPAVIMYGGFKYVTSEGNPTQIKEAQQILIWAGIGFFIMLLAKGAVGLIDSIFINPPPTPTPTPTP